MWLLRSVEVMEASVLGDVPWARGGDVGGRLQRAGEPGEKRSLNAAQLPRALKQMVKKHHCSSRRRMGRMWFHRWLEKMNLMGAYLGIFIYLFVCDQWSGTETHSSFRALQLFFLPIHSRAVQRAGSCTVLLEALDAQKMLSEVEMSWQECSRWRSWKFTCASRL